MSSVIYVSMKLNPDEITDDMLKALREVAFDHVGSAATNLNITNKNGDEVCVEFDVDMDITKPEDFFNASAARCHDTLYKIRMGAGLLMQLETISRSLVADNTVLRAMTRGKLLSAEANRMGIEEIMQDFFFHFSIGMIFWHEFSHIVMGHLDWLRKDNAAFAMSELHIHPLSPDEAASLQILEGDADKRAANFLIVMMDYHLKVNPYFRYENDEDLFHDFGYLIATVFQVFDALEENIPTATRTHPDNSTRTMVSVHYILEYLEKYRSNEATELRVACAKGAGEALRKTIHVNQKVPDEMDVLMRMLEIQFRLDEMGVKAHQLAVKPGRASISVQKLAA